MRDKRRMKTSATLLVFFAAASLGAASSALAKLRAGDASVLALDRVLSPAIQPLTVTFPAVAPGAPIPDVYTAFGKNISPPLTWEGAPPGVRSYVVIMEDPDSHGPTPTLHWLAYNIPGAVEGLGRAVRNRPEPKAPLGMMQGVNYAGGIGYIGPHPPEGDPPHHYHFEVFALDVVLGVKPNLRLSQVIAAMNDHVLAEGEVVATFAAPLPKPPTP